ncbi:MAG: polysaccharide biosynthesis tyrosine autokinase [Acidobacteriota bacterium]|nr:polysaccharide biosynthesis tyrosine autokinase [Acidobacteriota bacterium]
MEKDQRLTPLPNTVVTDLQRDNQDYPTSYAPFYDDDSFDEKRSIRQYFNIVYKRLPLILALTILTTAVAAFYMYRQPLQYMAQTEMLIEPRKPKVQTKDSINIFNVPNDANYASTQLQLLQNGDLMFDVVQNLGLHRHPNLLGNQNKGILATFRSIFSSDKTAENKDDSLPVLSETNIAVTGAAADKIPLTPEEQERAVQYAFSFLSGLGVEQIEQTNLVNIKVKGTNPALAAKVADTVAETFIAQDIERETQGAKDIYNELSKSIEDLKSTINSKEVELINFMRNGDLPLQEKGGELSASILQNLSGQWYGAIDERRKIEARYNAAVTANARGEGTYVPDITGSEIYRDTIRINAERTAKLQDAIREIDKQISAAENEKAQLLVKYTPEYSKVKEKEEQIAKFKETREKTETEVTKLIERDEQKIKANAISGALVGLRSQLEAATVRENQSRVTYSNELSKANIQGQEETRLTTLKREIETQRSLLDTYTQRQKEQELTISGSRPDNVKVTAHAITPTTPIGPQRTRNIMVAFLMSLAAGIGLAFLMDYLDDSVRTSDDVGRHLGLPTLALIPDYATLDKRTPALIPGKNGSGPSSLALITLEDRRSPVAEAYRHLRTSLLFSSAGKPPQTILVTSAQPSEGKTTTAINTAITLAQSDVDVVIIDCDLRRPRLHSHFSLDNTQGLTNYLSGERNTDNLVKTYKGLPRLKVITSGPIPPNPAELLSSNEMKNLLQFLKGNYKHVIIDSPPAISFTDAAILATLVDGVVLVAMAGKSSIQLMRRFKQRLGNLGTRIYGVVLNGIKANSAEYDYYGYNSTYSYYTASDTDDSTPRMEETVSIHNTKN